MAVWTTNFLPKDTQLAVWQAAAKAGILAGMEAQNRRRI
jgi:hypothetical protein